MTVGSILSGSAAVTLAASVVLAAGAGQAGAGARAHGSVQFWGAPGDGTTSGLVFAGAIGDYGSSTTVDGNGKPDPNGNFERVKLQKGTFLVGLAAVNAAAGKAAFPFDARGCSSSGSITGSAPVSGGTGAYKGISGSLRITLQPVWILARKADGKCDGQKVLFFANHLTGTGSVSYP